MYEPVSTSEISPRTESFEEGEKPEKLRWLDHRTKYFFSRRFIVICLLISLLVNLTIPYYYLRLKYIEGPNKKSKFGE